MVKKRMLYFLTLLLTLKLFASTTTPWSGTWHRNPGEDDATLEIEAKSNQSFAFKITSTSGANIGEVEETAQIKDSKTARAVFTGHSKPCELTFHLETEGSKKEAPYMNVETNGDCIESNGVEFDGKYYGSNQKPILQASFPCEKAASSIETTICSTPTLAEADKLLSDLYHSKQDSDLRGNLKKAQKAWLKNRDKLCATSKSQTKCLAAQYAERITELRQNRAVARPQYDDYAQLDPYDTGTKLKTDILVKLTVFQYLPEDHFDLWQRHNLVISEAPQKPHSDIVVFSNIKGTTESAATVLTQANQLWIGIPTVVRGNWVLKVYGPKESRSVPLALKQWIADFKQAKTKSTAETIGVF